MAKNSMDCDDVSGPSRTGFDPSMDWRRCLQKDLSTRSEVAQTAPTASVSSDLNGYLTGRNPFEAGVQVNPTECLVSGQCKRKPGLLPPKVHDAPDSDLTRNGEGTDLDC